MHFCKNECNTGTCMSSFSYRNKLTIKLLHAWLMTLRCTERVNQIKDVDLLINKSALSVHCLVLVGPTILMDRIHTEQCLGRHALGELPLPNVSSSPKSTLKQHVVNNVYNVRSGHPE